MYLVLGKKNTMKSIKKIVVPTDLSAISFVAMEYARPIAQYHRAQIYLLHVLESGANLQKRNALQATFNYHKGSSSRPDRCPGKPGRCDDVVCVLRRGNAWKEIIKFVREEQTDLIVLATQAKNSSTRFLSGTVAKQVVKHAPVPILIVKPSTNTSPMKGE